MTLITAIALLAGSQAVFAALMLATQRRGNRTANRLLAGYFAVFAANMANYAYLGLGLWHTHPQWAGLTRPLEFLYGPLFYGYVRVMTGHRLTRRSLLHLVPFAVALTFLAAWLVLPIETRLARMEESAARGWPVSWPRWAAGWCLLTAYLAAALIELRRHDRRLREQLSSLGRAGLRWLRRLTVVLLAGQLVELVSAGALLLGHPLHVVLYGNTLGIALMLYMLAFFAMRQPALLFRLRRPGLGTAGANESAAVDPTAPVAVAVLPTGGDRLPTTDVVVVPVTTEPDDEEVATKYRRSGLSAEQADRLVLELQGVMRTQRLWLDPDLSLAQLAERVGRPPHHVSQALNERLGTTFFDFVNGFRVDEVRRLLTDPRNAERSVLTLAFEAGFNSKTAFNTSFKSTTGLTPTAYRRRYLGSEPRTERTVA